MRRVRIDPLHALAAVLFIVVIGLAVFVGSNAQFQGRSGSALDGTSGGAARVRALVDELGGRTGFGPGAAFPPRDAGVDLLVMAGATGPVGEARRAPGE